MPILFNKPQKISAKVFSSTRLNEKDIEVIFEVVSPSIFEFRAGQFINLSCGNGLFRAYSISSTSLSNTQVVLIVAVGHDGVGSNYIKSLKVGDSVEFIGPSGRFVLPEVLKDNLIFIATGTGLAPLLSMIDYLNNSNTTSKVQLYFGVRDESEVFKIDQLNIFKSNMKDFNYTVCFSQDIPSELANVSVKGRVTDAIVFDKNNLDTTQYFICGNPYMVVDINAKLKDAGISENNIFHEKFTVTKQPTA